MNNKTKDDNFYHTVQCTFITDISVKNKNSAKIS